MSDIVTDHGISVSLDRTEYPAFSGHRLYGRDASIRVMRSVGAVWEAWTSRDFWKFFFSYDYFEGECCPASEFFARGKRNGEEFREHGFFSVVREGLALRYHVWHWGRGTDKDSDSSVTVSFKAMEDGSTKVNVLQIWRLLEGEKEPAFDWNVKLECIRRFLENICA